MNLPLFNDLYKLLDSVINHKGFTKTIFIHYLTGFSSPKSFSGIDYNTFEYNCLVLHYKLRTIFQSQYLEMRKLNQELKLEDLIRSISDRHAYICTTMDALRSKREDILKLYEAYTISIPSSTDTDHLLLNLFTECVTERPVSLFALYKKQNLKPQTIRSTFGRKEDAVRLKNELEQYHKVLITSPLGSGKSRFIKYCLSTWTLPDYCYIDYNSNLRNTLHKIVFKDDNNHKYFDFIYEKDLTDLQYSSSLLVIDNMYSSDNISDELEQLSKLSINIIVITICNVHTESFHTFELPELSDNILQNIFEYDNVISLQDENIKNRLFCITQRNLCMLSLISRLCKKAASQKPNNSSDILDKILSRLSILNDHIIPSLNHNKTTDCMESSLLTSKFKVTSDGKTLDLIGHIKSVYINAICPYLDDNAKTFIKYLCCFGWSPIPCEFLKVVLPSYNEDTIQTLSEMKLLELANDKIQLPPLIAHAVIAAEMPAPPDYDILVDNIVRFLKEYDGTLSIPYLSDILFVFVQTLYDNVRAKNYTNESKKPERSEKRKELLYMIHDYYNQTGDYVFSKSVLELIMNINLRSAYFATDIQLFTFNNNLYTENDIKTLSDQLDKICSSILADGNSNNHVDATNCMINILDIIIEEYCTNLFLLYIT